MSRVARDLSVLQQRYLEFLRSVPAPVQAKRFELQLVHGSEAASTEAAIYDLLSSTNLTPQLYEDASTGGADFECTYDGLQFAVEATSFSDEIVTERSGLAVDACAAGTLDQLTALRLLTNRVSTKGRQATRYSGPCVLAVGSTHLGASAVFSVAADALLVGQKSVSMNIATGEVRSRTKLQGSAFLRRNAAGNVEVFRKKYSIVLLCAVDARGYDAAGVVNPEPEYEVPLSAFSTIPVARLRAWPANQTLAIEWLRPKPVSL